MDVSDQGSSRKREAVSSRAAPDEDGIVWEPAFTAQKRHHTSLGGLTYVPDIPEGSRLLDQDILNEPSSTSMYAPSSVDSAPTSWLDAQPFEVAPTTGRLQMPRQAHLSDPAEAATRPVWRHEAASAQQLSQQQTSKQVVMHLGSSMPSSHIHQPAAQLLGHLGGQPGGQLGVQHGDQPHPTQAAKSLDAFLEYVNCSSDPPQTQQSNSCQAAETSTGREENAVSQQHQSVGSISVDPSLYFNNGSQGRGVNINSIQQGSSCQRFTPAVPTSSAFGNSWVPVRPRTPDGTRRPQSGGCSSQTQYRTGSHSDRLVSNAPLATTYMVPTSVSHRRHLDARLAVHAQRQKASQNRAQIAQGAARKADHLATASLQQFQDEEVSAIQEQDADSSDIGWVDEGLKAALAASLLQYQQEQKARAAAQARPNLSAADVTALVPASESDEVSNQRGKAAIGRQHQQGQGHSTTQPQGLQWSPMGPANADIIDLAAERHAAEPKHLPAQLQGAQLFPKPTEVPHPVELKLLELQRSTAEPLFVRPQHGTGIVWQNEQDPTAPSTDSPAAVPADVNNSADAPPLHPPSADSKAAESCARKVADLSLDDLPVVIERAMVQADDMTEDLAVLKALSARELQAYAPEHSTDYTSDHLREDADDLDISDHSDTDDDFSFISDLSVSQTRSDEAPCLESDQATENNEASSEGAALGQLQPGRHVAIGEDVVKGKFQIHDVIDLLDGWVDVSKEQV